MGLLSSGGASHQVKLAHLLFLVSMTPGHSVQARRKLTIDLARTLLAGQVPKNHDVVCMLSSRSFCCGGHVTTLTLPSGRLGCLSQADATAIDDSGLMPGDGPITSLSFLCLSFEPLFL